MEDNKMELAGNGTAESNESMNNESVNQNSVTDRELAADAPTEVAEGGAVIEETVSVSSDSDTPTSNGIPIDLSTVTGFKAVDANGNEIMVSKDELVNSVAENILMSLNARNGVMTLAENSTLAAAAASGTDEYENQLPVMNDCSHVRVLDSSGNPGLMTKQRNAEVVGGLIGIATAEKNGLMSKYDSQTITKSTGYGPGAVVRKEDLPVGFSYLEQVISEDFPSTSGCVIKFKFYATSFFFGWFGQFFVRCLKDGSDTGWQLIQTKSS